MSEIVIVKDYKGLRFINWWRFSLRTAKRLLRDRPTFFQALFTRAAAFAPIKKPVFILGCPRSGTTYLGNVLEMIPGVSYYFEPPIMKYYTRLLYEGSVSFSQAKQFYHWCCRSLLIAAPGTGHRVVEKNPNHTWVAESLLKIFPDARFVIISRDGRDTALSLYQKPWHLKESAKIGRREPGGYLYGPYPHFYIEKDRREEFLNTSDIHRCIWIWRRHAEQIEHLRKVLPVEQQFHIDYEELILKPRESLRNILEFIGENNEFAQDKVFEASREGHASSIGRWRKVFGDAELEIIEREAGEMLNKTRYNDE